MAAEPTRLASKRAQHLLRDISDKPFIAFVLPEDDDIKVYVSGLSPEKMAIIEKFVADIISQD